MRWMILLVVITGILSYVHFYWNHFPVTGLAAGFGYVCGAMRWRSRREVEDQDRYRVGPCPKRGCDESGMEGHS